MTGHFQFFARDASSTVRWRLLSGNNRDMGRSAGQYADAEAAVLALKDLLARPGAATASITPTTGNRWTWRLAVDGVVVAMASHSFDRRARCEAACAAFREAIQTAEVRYAVTLTGARTYRSRAS